MPSPRTPWSVFSAEQQTRWESFQSTLAAEAAAFRAGRGRTRLVLLGDSITEAWRGTSYGNPSERAAGVPEVLQRTLAKQFDASPLVLAISATRRSTCSGGCSAAASSAELRLTARWSSSCRLTRTAGHGHPPGEAADGVLAVARHLLSNAAGASCCRPSCRAAAAAPSTEAVPAALQRVGPPVPLLFAGGVQAERAARKGAAALSDAHPGRFRLATCGAPFLATAAEAPRR